jgi:hypothetical protein
MKAIMDYGGITPQSHGILPGDFFCISTNDNMLRYFADGDGLTGFHFEIGEPLRCLQLDWMHHALLAANECTTDYIPEWLSKCPRDSESLAYTLGYGKGRGELSISRGEWDAICPDWVDGLIFPWGCDAANYNSEAEVALTERGCRRVWQSIERLVVDSEWFDDRAEGWAEIAKLANLPGYGDDEYDPAQLALA